MKADDITAALTADVNKISKILFKGKSGAISSQFSILLRLKYVKRLVDENIEICERNLKRIGEQSGRPEFIQAGIDLSNEIVDEAHLEVRKKENESKYKQHKN